MTHTLSSPSCIPAAGSGHGRVRRILVCAVTLFAVTPLARGQQKVDFAHEVVPVLKKHCAECHTGTRSEGGFSFNTHRQILESGYVKPGEPADSLMIELLHSTDTDYQMPPSDRPRLTADQTSLLERWVAEGVNWEPGFRFAKAAWEPPLLPRNVEVPDTGEAGANPIDRILATHFQAHSQPAPQPVPGHVFLRRAYMDLIGIPPTLEEQRLFLSREYNDASCSQLVDELLDRRHDYAEHWMSFWNDLLRNDYAGTGYIDGGRSQITAWLYEALLNNLPYDEFVRQLISPTKQSEGFIRGIKWRGSVNASQVREIQFAQNVSQVFLGINMKCASCHDSFIDRWTLDEAYGLAAIFSERELSIHRCDKPTGRIASAKWIFPELGSVDPDADQPTRLKQLADLMTSPQNGRFSRTIANRVWHRLMGRGIVHPVDAMHTQPWNADLLDFLANYLVEQDYDLKALMKLIAESRVYRGAAAADVDPSAAGDYVFSGPIRRHLTAEQFMDAVWRLTGVGPQRVDAPIPPALRHDGDIPLIEKSGEWIWTYADTRTSPPGETATFRKQLSLEKRPRKATLVITCDNEYTAYVNGKKVGADNNWTTVEAISISRQLRRGENEILIVGRNGGNSANAASLYAELIIEDTLPEPVVIPTDTSWQAASGDVHGKNSAAAKWNAAVVVPSRFTPGPTAESAISRTISRVLNISNGITRAALLKSNMLMRSLGRPNREQVVTVRPQSLSTLQAIDLANGEILDTMLRQGAEQIADSDETSAELSDRLFRKTLVRAPRETERQIISDLLSDELYVESIHDFLWLLVMHPEFQFVH
ncbi:MAG: DUF1549 domain-containing protein [Planctomycetaceae bacterium]|nr:DUF1549 domain-containing protein [Planctomycetaceae bacterium]